MSVQKFETDIGGRKMTVEVGKFAGQADGACTVRYGDTVVLATAVLSDSIREGIDYFPLMVDYEERLYAAGKIKGSRFIKREGRPTDEAVLTSRLVDRSIRPFFDPVIRNDVQVVITVFSVDQENDPDVPALVAASCALMISDIPWNGPVAGVRVGQINDEWVLNPSYEAREKSALDLFVVENDGKIVMLEAGGQEVSEKTMVEALKYSQKHIKKIVELIAEVQSNLGKKKIVPASTIVESADVLINNKVMEYSQERIVDIIKIKDKAEREEKTKQLMDDLEVKLKDDNEVTKEMRVQAPRIVDRLLETAVRKVVLETGKRVDGRAIDELRPLESEVSVLPRTHGTGLFNRGETQVLSIVTLGSPGDEQLLDTMEESGKKRYMHHYNFPAFSVGETAPLRGPSRRDIGHGALAEKALVPVLPNQEDFPYTIRVVSEVLSSNGSSSMASTCGSTLALMDAGVPISKPVAGISIGMMSDSKSGEYKILTDIQGLEDHVGDMDFKVAGTKDGITAIQLDVKNDGLTNEQCAETLERAKIAREQILDVITTAIKEPRAELSQYAPRITTLRIDPDKIRNVIGKGGETINGIIDNCGGKDVTKIDIEDDGLVMVTSHSSEMAERAITTIKDLTRELKVGEEFDGTVTQIMTDRNTGKEIGAIVEVLPGKDGMVHISELSAKRVEKIEDVVKVGDPLKVKVVAVDAERDRISLSHRALTESDEDRERRKQQQRERRPFNSHRGGGGGYRNDRGSRSR
ncbi:polyribonucleotide nucleotidyltransferase [Patescibacteria group bacterium]|nr:polyribonucleotide nucleotidyltransferase [Patescibacteria group bacterium]MBU1889866.1 polyribonucleotide nucleotidyltransferase [Patescibacteria group bacterium]